MIYTMTTHAIFRATALATAAAFSLAASAFAQTTNNPFPGSIETEEGLIVVDIIEFALVPDADGEPARMMLMIDEPGIERMGGELPFRKPVRSSC